MCKWQIEDGFSDCPACPYDGRCDEQVEDARWDDSTFDEEDYELRQSEAMIESFI